MAFPPVSILIPAYNYAAFLGATLESALAQDFDGEIEVLVVDDGSEDDTSGVVASFGSRVRYHWKKNAGLSAARNSAMELAAHDHVVFLDADDLLEPQAVHRYMEEWQAAPVDPVVVGGRGRMIDAAGNFLHDDPPLEFPPRVVAFGVEDFVLRNRFAPIVLADRRALLALGGFEPALKASEDRDMWIRACTKGPVLLLDEYLYRKRDHGTNMSRHAARQTACILQVLDRAKSLTPVPAGSRVWKEAEAICLYQSARMYLAAGDRRTSLTQVWQSILTCPRLSRAGSAGYPPGFRMKFLLLEVAAQLGLRKEGGGKFEAFHPQSGGE